MEGLEADAQGCPQGRGAEEGGCLSVQALSKHVSREKQGSNFNRNSCTTHAATSAISEARLALPHNLWQGKRGWGL